MRILAVIDSLAASGAERSTVQLVPHLIKRGVDVDIAVLWDRPDLLDDLRSTGATLFSLAGSGRRVRRIGRASRLIERLRPDLVHTSLFEAHIVGRIAARRRRTPVVSTWTGLSYGSEHRRAPHLRAWKVVASQAADLATARVVDRFHAVSEHVADVMSRRLRVERSRVDVIPRGRDLRWLGEATKERRASARADLAIAPHERVVLAVARHDWKKGLDVLLHSFSAVRHVFPDSRLLIAGVEGHDTDALRRLAVELSLDGSLHFLGGRADIPELLCAADVFVLPSRSEGFPGVLLEALALEAPIVASDIPAVRDLIGGEKLALLTPPEDANEFARAIVDVLEHPAAADRRAHAGRRRFMEQFQVEEVAERMVEFYERTLSVSRR